MEISQIIYLTVRGQTSTSFKLSSYMSGYFNRELSFAAIENGYLDSGDLVTYNLIMNG